MPLAALTRELAEEIAREFPGLQRLNLSRNALRDVEQLRLLPHLAQLDLSRNALRALPVDLGVWLSRLARLNIRGNQIESLVGLAKCRALVSLDAGDNCVALLGELRHLAPLESLEELSLDGNPVESRHGDAFRREVLAMIPQLRVLDEQAVTPAERLYSRLQMKSELVVNPVVQHEEDLEHHAGDNGATDSPNVDTHTSYTGGGRLLTPASVTREFALSQEDPDDVWIDLADSPTIEQARRRSTPAASSSRVASMHPSPPPKRSHRVNWTPREHEIQAPLSPTEHTPHPASSPHNDAQLEVILDESGHSVSHASYHEPSRRTDDTRIVFVKSPYREASNREHRASEPSEIVLLQSRVNALERILALHDSTMQKELVRMAENRQSPLQDLASREQAAQIYMKVLSMWREKAVALMVQLQSTELAQSARKSQENGRLEQLEEACSKLQLKCEMWEQRVKDMEAQRDIYLARVKETEKRCETANAKAVAAVRTMSTERQKLQQVAEMVAVYSSSEGVVAEKMDDLARGVKHIDAFQRQLCRIQDRLRTASLLADHREARLRNTEAAMEAERRILMHQIEKLQAGTSSRSPENVDRTASDASTLALSNISDSIHVSTKAGSAAHKLRRHRKLLRPATEVALRAVFHRMDVYETGLVRPSALVDALRMDSGVKRAVGGDEALNSLVAHIELALKHKSKDPTLDVTLSLPKQPGSDKITWGEFLLLFLPDIPSEFVIRDSALVHTLTADSLVLPCELCRSTLLRHGSIPEYDGENLRAIQDHSRSVNRREEGMTRRELIAELFELRRDRDALRQRVLADAHALQNRAATISKEWRGKVEHLACENDDLRRTLANSQQEVAALRKQWEESERSAAAVQHSLDNLRRESLVRDADFSREKQLLESQHKESLRREQDIWKKELEDVGFQHSTLQAEHLKQQAYLRQLERELASTREHVASRESERVSNLESRVAKRDDEISKLRRERNTLLSTLRDLERQLAVQNTKAETSDSSAQTDEEAVLEASPTPVTMRSVASQTFKSADDPPSKRVAEEMTKSRSARLPDDIGSHGPAVNLGPIRAPRISPEDVTRRLERLQSLTASLLDD